MLTKAGYLFNTIAHGCQELYQPHKLRLEQRILRMIDVQDSFAFRDGRDDTREELFKFDFQLRNAQYGPNDSTGGEDGTIRRFNGSLPCSLGVFGPWCSHAVGQACCQAESLIKYELEAKVYKGDDVLISEAQPVRIFDCPDTTPPPVHLAHFPGEFICSDQQALKSIYSVNRSQLAVSVAEPKAVEIRLDGEVAMAALGLRFTMRDADSPPRQLDVRVNSILKALTFISAAKMDSQPTVKQSKHNPFLAAVPKWGRSYHRKLRVCQWTKGNGPREFVATALLWMPVSEGATPAPTFFTPCLARRYSAALRLDVKGGGKAVFNLHVPIQIVYSDPTMDVPSYETATSTPTSEEEGFDFEPVDELPIYVR
jgi:hypothetical protein